MRKFLSILLTIVTKVSFVQDDAAE